MTLLVEHPRAERSPIDEARPLPPAVRCRGLSKEFGTGEARSTVLRGIDLDVPPGELTLLVGPSGCGKTTLISIIAGLLNPTSGSVQVLGRDLGTLSGNELVDFRAAHIGFVFQQYNLLPALSAAENAAVPLVIAGVPWAEAVARGRAMLDAVGLAHRADAPPSQLSGGQQQRVAIARALVSEPRLLVCDEPTAALDASSGRTVMELIRSVSVRPDRAVIVVTHDSRVLDLGDRTIAMVDGMIDSVSVRS
ncbi:ABC transporter ATP-binding protein [Tautonia rosea]|uniref:ABC transporter ATP-binding protein n=1 Tax=Tautonia rosea TaxID=2728037 RepID=UPI001475DC54|nr:ABC transporter ATP-binding protein [Tautonia rosea]